MSKTIDELLQTPYWIIDILPKQVPAVSPGQYFAIERYYLDEKRIEAIKRQHIDVVLRLNCYRDVSIDEGVTYNPFPEMIATEMLKHYLCILVDDAMILSEPDDTHLTLFNPDDELLELVTAIATGAGLFVWQPPQ